MAKEKLLLLAYCSKNKARHAIYLPSPPQGLEVGGGREREEKKREI